MDPKIRSKAKKLLALAERGVGGEKEIARRMLDKFLAMHDLALSDIEGEEVRLYTFGFRGKLFRRLTAQVIAKVQNTYDPEVWITHNQRGYEARLTAAQAIEVEILLETLKPALSQVVEDAYIAFIDKNRLYPDCESPDAKLSPEEIERWERVLRLSDGIEKTEIHKRITG
ncbi:putative methionine S-methyltransferase [Pseudomonas phage RSP]|nr:putative methionine S-methyltransferase [Pseudomonas phage RSP]